jgi:hypothetical protein
MVNESAEADGWFAKFKVRIGAGCAVVAVTAFSALG